MNANSLGPAITFRWCHSGNNKRDANMWNIWRLFLEQETIKQSTKSCKAETKGKMIGTEDTKVENDPVRVIGVYFKCTK